MLSTVKKTLKAVKLTGNNMVVQVKENHTRKTIGVAPWEKGTSPNVQNTEKHDPSILNFYPSKNNPRKNLFIPTDPHDQGASF